MHNSGNSNRPILTLAEAAIQYAARRCPVFPVWWAKGGRCGCGKPRCSSPGKHPIADLAPRGLQDATTDPAIVSGWWKRHPRASIGVRTGPAPGGCGMWVLDVDAGTPALAALQAAALAAEDPSYTDTLRATTGGGGAHLFYRCDPDVAAWLAEHRLSLASRSKVRGIDGLDTRADGGYVVVAPSVHTSGRPYQWHDREAAVLPAPEWLLRMVCTVVEDRRGAAASRPPPSGDSRTRAYALGVVRRASERIAAAVEGERHDTILREARTVGGFLAAGLDRAEAEAALCSAGEATGKDAREVRRTVSDGLNLGEREPLVLPDDAGAGGRGGPPRDARRRDPAPRNSAPWPVLDAAALHGPAGAFVQLVGPHTEADPAAVLLHLLATFGALVGRGPFVQVGADQHTANLFVSVVGQTGAGRKGTAWGEVKRLLTAADPTFVKENVRNGLSSGEGLIHAVRDPSAHSEAGAGASRGSAPYDPGVLDKRLLVVEPEFARQLKVMKREGNTLSALVRAAWDSGDLGVMTRDPYRATGAHIVIVSHITRAELIRTMPETEYANGFGNRLLWVCAKRSKELPDGGALADREIETIALTLTRAAEVARSRGRVERTPAASERWRAEYSALSRERPGIFGGLTSRAAPQVLRLALVYALLDGSDAIDVPHLEAALAIWRYCAASVRWVFGDALGDPLADTILAALRESPGGMSRTDIRDYLTRNRNQQAIDGALGLLADEGLARVVQAPTGGRPGERWFACAP